MTEKVERRIKTRCYYTEYVNHMIRFYITCPETLKLAGKRKADMENWIAVQATFHGLSPENSQKVIDIYQTHYNLPKAVDMYCEKTGADKMATWILLTKVASIIARRRGLV